jgi:hypothetical protein
VRGDGKWISFCQFTVTMAKSKSFGVEKRFCVQVFLCQSFRV